MALAGQPAIDSLPFGSSRLWIAFREERSAARLPQPPPPGPWSGTVRIPLIRGVNTMGLPIGLQLYSVRNLLLRKAMTERCGSWCDRLSRSGRRGIFRPQRQRREECHGSSGSALRAALLSLQATGADVERGDSVLHRFGAGSTLFALRLNGERFNALPRAGGSGGKVEPRKA